MYIHTYIRTYVHTHIHTHTYIRTHTYIYTYIHTYIHTHKRTFFLCAATSKGMGIVVAVLTILTTPNTRTGRNGVKIIQRWVVDLRVAQLPFLHRCISRGPFPILQLHHVVGDVTISPLRGWGEPGDSEISALQLWLAEGDVHRGFRGNALGREHIQSEIFTADCQVWESDYRCELVKGSPHQNTRFPRAFPWVLLHAFTAFRVAHMFQPSPWGYSIP